MSLLVENFRKQIAKEKDLKMTTEAGCGVGYPTGFHTVDMNNGMWIHVHNPEKNYDFKYISAGIPDGSMIQVVGRSQAGKSTFCMQAGANIVRPFKSSCIFEDSIERGMTWPRRILLTGWDEEEVRQRVIPRDKGITAENFYKRIKKIHDLKMSEPDKYLYNTGLLDNFGNEISLFEPTVYILDSLPLLMPEQYNGEDGEKAKELAGQMSSTSAAKTITQIMRTIIPMLTSANIILFVINHILPNVSIDGRSKQSQLSWLAPDERLPKGETNVFLANCIIRFKDHQKLDENEKYKEAGKLVDVFFEKSRSSMPHCKTTLIFTFDHGYDPLLSLFFFLKEGTERMNGAGVGLYLDDRSDMKFSMGNFKQKFDNDEEFRNYFLKVAQEELIKIPKFTHETISKNREAMNDLYSMCFSYRVEGNNQAA